MHALVVVSHGMGSGNVLHRRLAAHLERGLTAAAPLEHRVVAGAGHYSFLSPYPPEMIGPDAPASLDPGGFDRPAFHEEMEGEILGFLRRVL